MEKHQCVQCVHYRPSGKSDTMGECLSVGGQVWSRSPKCLDGGVFEPKDTLGNRIRTARETSGLSRPDICAEFSVSLRAVQEWENDQRKPSAYMQKCLFAYFERVKNQE